MWWRNHDNIFSRFDRVPACDGRTDGRTDVKPIAITCFSIADARKNQRVRSIRNLCKVYKQILLIWSWWLWYQKPKNEINCMTKLLNIICIRHVEAFWTSHSSVSHRFACNLWRCCKIVVSIWIIYFITTVVCWHIASFSCRSCSCPGQ